MMMHSAQSSMAEKPIATVRQRSYDAASGQHVGRSLIVLVGTYLGNPRKRHGAQYIMRCIIYMNETASKRTNTPSKESSLYNFDV